MERTTKAGAESGYAYAQAGEAIVAAASAYVSMVNVVLQEEMMRWFFQWSFPNVWGIPTPADEPVSLVRRASAHREAGDDDALPSDADAAWPDIIDKVEEDPFARTVAGDFNVALHDLQEAVFAGQFARDNPYALPPGYTPVLRPWPQDRRTEPYEL